MSCVDTLVECSLLQDRISYHYVNITAFQAEGLGKNICYIFQRDRTD